jgi:hypothetical protein
MSNDSKEIELKTLRDKCLLFNQFMIEKGGMSAALVEALAEAFKESNRLIEKAYTGKDLKPLQAMNRDIDNQILKHMSFQMASDIKRLFKEKLGIDFEEVDKTYKKVIEKIFKRGKIANTVEYELLENRLDEIYADPNKEGEVKQLNELLAAYHK